MMLSDKDILRAVEEGEVQIEPLRKDLLQPASLDLLLSSHFVFFKESAEPLDPNQISENCTESFTVKATEAYILKAKGFLLASTEESITLSNKIAARFEGKSTLARCGLLTHVTAGFIDPGFTGKLTLELFNLSNRGILLRPSMPIGQLSFFKLTSSASRAYGSKGLHSKYQYQKMAQAPKSLRNHSLNTDNRISSWDVQ